MWSRMLSKFQEWMTSQEPEFIQEICRGRPIPIMFKDYGQPITLDELKELDNKYINPED